MKPFRSSFGATVSINAKLFGAALFGFTAWVIWPSSSEWWQFRVLSIMIALVAASTLIAALKAMGSLYGRNKALAQFEAQGTKPKSSALASGDALRRSGMTDG